MKELNTNLIQEVKQLIEQSRQKVGIIVNKDEGPMSFGANRQNLL